MCLGENLKRKREIIYFKKCSELPNFFFLIRGSRRVNKLLACFSRLKGAPGRAGSGLVAAGFVH